MRIQSLFNLIEDRKVNPIEKSYTSSLFAEVLTEGKADAALAASLFHDGKLRIAELKRELHSQNVPIRL